MTSRVRNASKSIHIIFTHKSQRNSSRIAVSVLDCGKNVSELFSTFEIICKNLVWYEQPPEFGFPLKPLDLDEPKT